MGISLLYFCNALSICKLNVLNCPRYSSTDVFNVLIPPPWSSRTCMVWECFVMESFHANCRGGVSITSVVLLFFALVLWYLSVCVRARARLFHCVTSPQTPDTSPGVYFENFLLLNTLKSWEGTIAKSTVTGWNYLMKFSLSVDLLVALQR